MPLPPDPSLPNRNAYYGGVLEHPQDAGHHGGRVPFDVSLYGIGLGPTRLDKRKLRLFTKGDEPPIGDVRKDRARYMAQMVWADPGDRDCRFLGLDDPKRTFEMRKFKTGPAYFLSKALRGITYNEAGVIVPYCTVILKRTRDNTVIATTVSDANGAYYFTVAD